MPARIYHTFGITRPPPALPPFAAVIKFHLRVQNNAAAAGRSNTVQLICVGVQMFRDREVYNLMVQPRVY